MPPSTPEPLRPLLHWFEQLTPQSLDGLAEHYAADARFKDPFNDVRGHAAIRGIFAHMFARLHAPRFEVTAALQQGQQAFVTWTFHFALRSAPQQPLTIQGATHLELDDQGRVSLHRDYWDAAEELYEKLPLLGALMRWLKRRVNA